MPDSESPDAPRRSGGVAWFAADAGRALVAAVLLAIVVQAAVGAFVSTTRTRIFTVDSWIYVDAARHVAAGDGLVQSAVGGNMAHVPADVPVPAPMTEHGPLFPLALAAASRLGASPVEASLVIPALSFAAALGAGWLLGREIGGASGGLGAVAGLALFQPVREISLYALSDVPALVLGLLCLAGAARARRTGDLRAAAGAGAACGLAFAARYALWPLAPCAALALVDPRDLRTTIRRLVALATPCALVVAVVVGRNYAADGTLVGPDRLPSTVGLKANLVAVLDVFAFWALPVAWPPKARLLALASVFVAALVLDVKRPGDASAWSRRAPVVFAAAYVALLVAMRTRRHFDPVNARLVLPAGAALAAWAGATIARAVRLPGRAVAASALAALGLGFWTLADLASSNPRRSPGDEVAASPRSTWIAANVRPGDCVIGDDVEDVPFHLPGVGAFSFSPWPYTERPTRESIGAFVRAHAGQFARFVVVLRKRFKTRDEWTDAYGPFVADLALGDKPPCPEIEPIARLADGYVFRFSP